MQLAALAIDLSEQKRATIEAMRSYSSSTMWPAGRPQPGPATKVLAATLLFVSAVSSLTQRKLGFGAQDLVFDSAAVLDLELWRPVTYAFVKAGNPIGLLLSAAVLYLFGCAYEQAWGTRDFVRFFFLSAIGAAVLAIPLSLGLNQILPFGDLARAEGPDAAIDAMLVAMAYNAPDANVLFGFVLPIRARSVVLLLLGIDVLAGMMNGAASLSVTLGGLLMGYLLVSGMWRPQYVLMRLKLYGLRRRRRGLYVVPPKNSRHLN